MSNSNQASIFGYKIAFRKFQGVTKVVFIEELNGMETVLAVGRGTAFDVLDVPAHIKEAAPICELVLEHLPSCFLELPTGN